MTIPAGQTSVTVSISNGVAVDFPYNFKITSASDLLVTTIDTDDNQTVLDLGVDYTVSGVENDAGGSISLINGPLDDQWRVACEDNVEVSQTSVYANQTSFFGIKHENSYDKNVRLIKRLFDSISSSFRLPSFITGVSTVLPSPEAYNGFRWNAAGTGLENKVFLDTLNSGSGNIQVSSNGQGGWTISAVGMGGGDVTEAGDNQFTGKNTFGDYAIFKGSTALPTSNDFGEVILSSGRVSIMVGDGSNTSNTELASFGPAQGRLKLGGVQIDASSGTYKELNHNADLFYVGKFNSVNAFFSDLADITSYLSSISLAPFISMQCYVADQGMAIYYPPSITGLPANAWVLLHDPTTAIT